MVKALRYGSNKEESFRVMFKPKKQCTDCQAANMCRDSAISWIFLLIGVIATISIRVVNLVLPFGVFWSKFFWYLGVAGFFLYFLYKFREDKILRARLEKHQIHRKLADNQSLDAAEKEFLKTMLCRMRSNKDAINYFFIFSSSAIVLLLAVYQDFINPSTSRAKARALLRIDTEAAYSLNAAECIQK